MPSHKILPSVMALCRSFAEPFGTVFFFRPASWVYHINLRKPESILEHIIVFIVLSAIPGQISPSITAVNIAAVLGHNVGVRVIGPQALQQVFQHIYIAVVELPDIVMRVLAAIARERLCRCKLIQINTVAAISLGRILPYPADTLSTGRPEGSSR